MDNINWSLVAPLIVIQPVLMLVALIDLRRTAATKGPRWMWALIIIFVNILGPIAYFVGGRRE